MTVCLSARISAWRAASSQWAGGLRVSKTALVPGADAMSAALVLLARRRERKQGK